MKRYTVRIPIQGSIVVEVDSENEDQAIEDALNNHTIDDLDTWEQLEQECEILFEEDIEA